MPTYVRSGGAWLDVSGGGGSPSIPSGVSILFYEASAPTGWTKVTTQDNKALRVVSGTGRGSGGSASFTSVFTNRGVPLAQHSHSVSDPGHSHNINDPGHSHGVFDPGHAHGVFDPGHGHGFSPNNGGFKSLFMSVTATGGDAIPGISAFPENNFNDSDTSSVSRGQLNGNGTGIGIFGSGTGIGIFGSGTGVGINGNGTGISINNNGTAGASMDFAVQYIDVILCTKN